MVTRLPTLETHLRTGARNVSVPLSRLAAILVAAIAGLLGIGRRGPCRVR
jgi:hypothetical protein